MKVLTTRTRRILTGTIALLILAFTGLTALVYFFPTSVIDLRVSAEVQEHHNLLLDQLMILISWVGTMPWSVLLVLLSALAFYLFSYRREALFTVLTLSSGLISTVIKMLINRPRPGKDIVRVIEITRQQSFPSGHTLFYTIFFGFLIIVMASVKTIHRYVRTAVILISSLMILLIPFSRIYLGAHWFTDVLAGAILGILCLFVLGYFYLDKPNGYTKVK